ncbi:hypothetical protein [Bradyrhizobium commune]|uniref:Uncharacterized protein n=1 Tax=Bradyrhizobium commune TaxID=83627 RepID=A0A7S9D1N9_9BRAD|nr:hypothetical protein [Bradyrhizobium commune]QPF89542.1 hypothetical protein IC761_23915 [Bradyrhizobium commune]
MQKQEVRKNYIGLVNDTSEDEQTADTALRSQPHVIAYLLGRLADALKGRHKGTPGPIAR